MTLHFLEV